MKINNLPGELTSMRAIYMSQSGCTVFDDIPTSAFVLAETLLTLPRKLCTFITLTNICRIKVSQLCCALILKTKSLIPTTAFVLALLSVKLVNPTK